MRAAYRRMVARGRASKKKGARARRGSGGVKIKISVRINVQLHGGAYECFAVAAARGNVA